MVKPKRQGTNTAKSQASEKSVTKHSIISDFSYVHALTWKPTSQESTTDVGFISASFQPTFQDFGSINCRPNSRARTQRRWNTHTFCMACIRPHSLGLSVSNWSLRLSMPST